MMRKARILHDGNGNYFADYLNIRLDITEEIAIIKQNAMRDGYIKAHDECVEREYEKTEQLVRYQKICDLVSQDVFVKCGPKA